MKSNETVFRRVAIDRLTSPDELTEILRFTQPLDWMLLGTVALVMICGLVWGLTASLDVTEPVVGILGSSGTNERGSAIVLVREEGAKRIVAGQAVRLTSSAFPPQQYGSLTGTVLRTNRVVMGDLALRRTLMREDLARVCMERGLRVLVDVAIDSKAGDLPGSSLSRQTGMEVRGEVVIRRERPLECVLPWLRSIRGDPR